MVKLAALQRRRRGGGGFADTVAVLRAGGGSSERAKDDPACVDISTRWPGVNRRGAVPNGEEAWGDFCWRQSPPWPHIHLSSSAFAGAFLSHGAVMSAGPASGPGTVDTPAFFNEHAAPAPARTLDALYVRASGPESFFHLPVADAARGNRGSTTAAVGS